MLKSWSSTQITIALSSAEAELYAMSKCAQQAVSLASIAQDFGMDLQAHIFSDSTAALGIAYRRGLGGKTRHVRVQYLWLQEMVSDKRLSIDKVGTMQNLADVLTTCLGIAQHEKHMVGMNYEFQPAASQLERAMRNLQKCEDLAARLHNFAKHANLA